MSIGEAGLEFMVVVGVGKSIAIGEGNLVGICGFCRERDGVVSWLIDCRGDVSPNGDDNGDIDMGVSVSNRRLCLG